MENTYQSPWACAMRTGDPFCLSFSAPMFNTLSAQKHPLVCILTFLIHCFRLSPRHTREPLRVRTLIHTVSFGSHTVQCAELARWRRLVTKRNSYTLLNAPIRLVTSLLQKERKGSQHFWTPVWILQLPCPHVRLSLTFLGCWHGHLTPYDDQLASTHCQANVLSHFSGEGTRALLRGQTPKLLTTSAALISAKCHGWPSLLPRGVRASCTGAPRGRASPQGRRPCLVGTLRSLEHRAEEWSPNHHSVPGCCAQAIR